MRAEVVSTKRGIVSVRCACLAALILGVSGCRGEEPPPPELPLRTVRYLEVHAVGGVRERTFTGFSKADIRSEFSFRVSGVLSKIHVREGEIVTKGTLMAEIDPSDLNIEVRKAEASLAEARAQLVLADAEFNRIQALFERDNASRGEFDSALAKRESAQARIDAGFQQIEQAKSQVAYTRLTAPITCAVIDVKFEEGEAIQARAALVEVVSGENPQVEVAVPENLIAELHNGNIADVSFSAVPDRDFRGEITTIGIVPSEGLTTYPVTITLDESWAELSGSQGVAPIRPGMALEARMRFGSGDSTPRHLVPAHAVREDEAGRFVYVVISEGDAKGVVKRRSVETGQLVTEGVEVLSGLTDGERVVIAGLNQIQEGQKVRLLTRN